MKPANDFTQSRFDLIDAFGGGECAVCALGRKSVERYIAAINYDSVGDPGVRRQFMQAQGFCNIHAYQWLDSAFVLGTASLFRELFQILVEEVQSVEHSPNPLGERVGRWLGYHTEEGEPFDQPAERCPACVWLAATESMLIDTMTGELLEPSFRSAFEASAGLCLPHVRQALAHASTEEAFSLVRDHTIALEITLIAQLGKIIRKHDYRFREESAGDEVGAAARAVGHVIGFHGLTRPQ